MGASRDFGTSSNEYSISWSSILSGWTGYDSTLGVWMRADGEGSGGIVLFGTNSSGGIAYWQLDEAGAKMYVQGSANITWSGGVSTDGAWHFWLFTSALNDVAVYKDGVLEASKASSGANMTGSAKNFQAGRWIGGNSFALDGDLAHLQFFDRKLSVEEGREIMWRPGSINDGLLIYCPLYGVDSPELDLSGNGLDGTVNSATESSSGPPVSFGRGPIVSRGAIAGAPAGDVRPRFHHHRHHNRAA